MGNCVHVVATFSGRQTKMSASQLRSSDTGAALSYAAVKSVGPQPPVPALLGLCDRTFEVLQARFRVPTVPL